MVGLSHRGRNGVPHTAGDDDAVGQGEEDAIHIIPSRSLDLLFYLAYGFGGRWE